MSDEEVQPVTTFALQTARIYVARMTMRKWRLGCQVGDVKTVPLLVLLCLIH